MKFSQPATLDEIPSSVRVAIAKIDGLEYSRMVLAGYSAQTQGWSAVYCPIVDEAAEAFRPDYDKISLHCQENGWDFDAIRAIVAGDGGALLSVDFAAIEAANKYESALVCRVALEDANSAYWDSLIAEQDRAAQADSDALAQLQEQERADAKAEEARVESEFRYRASLRIKAILSGVRCSTTLQEAIDHHFQELRDFIYLHPSNLSIDGYIDSIATIEEFLRSPK